VDRKNRRPIITGRRMHVDYQVGAHCKTCRQHDKSS
jgi:hypothetical protein